MLAEGRISDDDYAVLRQAFDDNQRGRADRRALVLPKRLSKSWERRRIGGVCAGIADALGVEPIAIRVLFMVPAFLPLFFSPLCILVYVILYFVFPWKEEEKHLVKNFPFAFPAIFALLLILSIPVNFNAPAAYELAARVGRLESGSGANLLHLLRACHGLQNFLIRTFLFHGYLTALMILAYVMLPVEGSSRKWFARISCFSMVALCTAVFLLFVAVNMEIAWEMGI
jgi:phage shock protein C